MEKQSSEWAAFFEDSDKFICNVDPKKVTPPFITTELRAKRREAFKLFKKYVGNGDEPAQRENLLYFINKFEVEYVNELKDKLKEKYVDFILQKKYDLPSEINIREVKGVGALPELNNLAVNVAEWTLELEILAYNLEGLNLYGLKTYKATYNSDFLTIFKTEYNYKKTKTFKSVSQYLVQRMINFSLRKFASLAIAKGLSKVQLGGRAIWEIFFTFSMTSKIPWQLIIKYLNVPWILGGFAASLVIHKISQYVAKEEIVSNMTEIEESFEIHKISIIDHRRIIFDEVAKILQEKDLGEKESKLKRLSQMIDRLLEPPVPNANEPEEIDVDIDKYYNIKELEDCVLIEEKDFTEYIDESGVVVIE